MWSKELTIKVESSREQIWKLWSDVGNWKDWDKTIEYSKLEGDFKQGSKGILKPKKGPKTKFEILEIDYLKKFTSRSNLPLAKMDFIHELTEKEGELYLTHRLEIKGVLSPIFSRIIGENIIKELPEVMSELSNLSERE